MNRHFSLLGCLPYAIAVALVVPIAVLIKWKFVSWLGAGMPNCFLVHEIFVLVSLVLACGAVATIALLVMLGIVALHYISATISKRAK